jgi:hypothetical protein
MQRIIRFTVAALALLLAGGLLPPAMSAQPDPARSLAGQSITACKGEFRFRFAVVSADWRSTISDRTAAPGSMWAVAVADVTNLGGEYGYPQGLVGVRDTRGRSFDWVLFNGLDEYVENEIANEYDVTPSWAGAEAGATTRTVLIFLVASDATALTLTPNDIGCSGDIVATTSAPTGGTAPAPRPAPSAPASPAPAPSGGSAQRTPASSLTGQSVTACKGAERYRFSIVSADWRSTISDRSAPAGMMWAAAVADVTNLSSDYGYFQGLVGVRDDRGRLFDWVLFNGPDIYVEDEIAYEYDLLPSWAGAEAGATVRIVIPFLVSSSATSLTLVPNNIGCGG